jgi:hypothetical protein
MDPIRHLIFITLSLLLMTLPCQGEMPQPTGSGNMPDLYPANLPDITVGPIVYLGPTLADIGMKLIAYEGPDLADITVDPIQYIHHTIALVQQPTIKPADASSAKPVAIVLVPQPIPGVQPSLRILSPKPGQTFSGNVPLEVEISGWQGVPPVNLAWWWSPPSAAGKWPATPQGMTVVEGLDGKTRITIPRSAFPESGLWRLEASVRVSDHQRVADDVSFTLAGTLSPASATGTKKMAPTKIAPVSVPNKTPTAPRVPALPTPPTRQSVAPQ